MATQFAHETTGPGARSELQFFEMHGTEFNKIVVDFEGVPVVDYFKDQIDVAVLVPTDQETLRANLDRSSLYAFNYTPQYYLPTHYHDQDQIQFVVDGELHGRGKCLRPGQGVFTPAGQAYNLQMGRSGCRFIEFKAVGIYRTAYVGQRDRERIGAGDVLPETIEGWAPREENRGRVTIFDAETAPVEAHGSRRGPGGDDVAPLLGKVAYQPLVVPPASPDLHMFGAFLAPGTVVPEHSQDVERIVYVLSGELEFGDGRVMREGDGFFAAPNSRCTFESVMGAHLLEFHPLPRWSTTWY